MIWFEPARLKKRLGLIISWVGGFMRQCLRVLKDLACAALIGTGFSQPALAQTRTADLTIASWGGFYQKAQTQVLAEPFGLQSGQTVSVVTYTGNPNEVRQKVSAYRDSGEPVGWDVVDLERADAETLCFQGYLQPMQHELMGLQDFETDFIDGAIGLCWVGNVVWSQSFGFDRRLFSGAEPYALTDAFDPTLFPGRRLLTLSAEVVMELALLSEGVAPARVYERLGTREGVAEALAVLNRVRGNVQFIKSTEEIFKMLKTGQGSIGLIHHFDALRELRSSGLNIGYLWDSHVIDLDVFAIPAGARKPVLAADFIANVSRGAYQSAMATVTGYGPSRLSAANAARADLREWLPTGPENLNFGLSFRADFWTSIEGKAAQAAYDAWRGSVTGTL